MSKGEATRAVILERAAQLASVSGFEALSIGGLSEALGMSKSGVFAHFRSKDSLDLAVLEYVRDRFVDSVLLPSFKARRGIARIESLRDRMIAWMQSDWLPGGCPLLASGFEFDDRPGKHREFVASVQRDLLAAFSQSARIAIDEKQFSPDLDCDQFAFDLHGAILAAHQASRLRQDPAALRRFHVAVGRLIADARIRTT